MGEAEGAVHAQAERLGPQLLVAGAKYAATKVRTTGTRAASRIQRKARWWARSASRRRKNRRKKSGYMRDVLVGGGAGAS